MEKIRRFINVCISDLYYPMKVGVKSKAEGENTLVKIMIKAEIEIKHTEEFKTRILEIINDRSRYIGPIQLTNRLISFINTLNANSFVINFRYPLFIEENSPSTNKKRLMKYHCEQIIIKNSLIKYKKLFKVEVPIIVEYIVPGIQRDILEIPKKIIVEIEGFENIFAEDIIEIVENALRSEICDLTTVKGNMNLSLLNKLQNELENKYKEENCCVKVISKKLFYTSSEKISWKNPARLIENKYLTEQTFS
jgi:hypothetical protein